MLTADSAGVFADVFVADEVRTPANSVAVIAVLFGEVALPKRAASVLFVYWIWYIGNHIKCPSSR